MLVESSLPRRRALAIAVDVLHDNILGDASIRKPGIPGLQDCANFYDATASSPEGVTSGGT